MLMGMPVSVRWYAPLPEPCVVVANHCSYLDGVVLAARSIIELMTRVQRVIEMSA